MRMLSFAVRKRERKRERSFISSPLPNSYVIPKPVYVTRNHPKLEPKFNQSIDPYVSTRQETDQPTKLIKKFPPYSFPFKSCTMISYRRKDFQSRPEEADSRISVISGESLYSSKIQEQRVQRNAIMEIPKSRYSITMPMATNTTIKSLRLPR